MYIDVHWTGQGPESFGVEVIKFSLSYFSH